MEAQKENLLWKLYLPAILCTLLWGSAVPSIKEGYILFAIDDTFSQFLFAGMRFSLAGVMVLIAAKAKGQSVRPARSDVGAILSISLFQTILQYLCYYTGASRTSGTNVSVLSGTQTFFALILAHFLLRDRLDRKKALGCFLGLCGVVVLGAGGFEGVAFLGDALILMSAVSAAMGTLVSRRVTPGRNPMMLTGWQLLIGGVLLLAVGFLGGGSIQTVTPAGILLLLYMAALSATAFTIWTGLLGKYPVTKVSIFGFLIPVFGTLLSGIFLRERVLTARNVIVLLCVCSGIALSNTASKTAKKASA